KLQKDDIGVFDIEWAAILDYSDYTDFGKGFYTFPQEFKDLAMERAKDSAKRKGEKWAVIRFEFLPEELKQIANILLFENKKTRPQNAPRVPVTDGEPANWLQFVEYNRGLKQYPQRPKDNDWTDQYGWMRGPLWVPRDSGIAKGRPRFADHVHQVNWGRTGLV